MLALLWCGVWGEQRFVTLRPENFDLITRSQKPTLVRFYTAHRKQSVDLDEQWDMIVDMYQGVDAITVGGVNCGKFRYFCYDVGVSTTPEIRLYTQNTTYMYDGGCSHESVTSWVAANIKVDAKRLHMPLLRPNTRTFHELLNTTQCVVALFYNSMSPAVKRLVSAIRDVAVAFQYDDSVAFCQNDVDLYKWYNWDFDMTDLPMIRAWAKGEDSQKWPGKKGAQELLDWVNDYCATQRGLDGRLTSDAGLNEEAHGKVEEFMTKGHQEKYIAQLEQLADASLYVWAAKEVAAKGTHFVTDERARLQKLIADGNISPQKIDEFQLRLNVLGVFASYMD